MSTVRAVRLGPVSWQLRLRTTAVLVAGVAILGAAACVALALGTYTMPDGGPVTPWDVIAVLTGGGDEGLAYVVWDLRLPRILTGALVGAALALSGAITQGIARNPLSSPDILGVTAGSSVAAVAVIALSGSRGQISGVAAEIGVPVASMLGGLLAALGVFVLAWRNGIEGYRLVLVGLGAGSLLSSVTFWLLSVGDVDIATRAVTWLTGSLNGSSWIQVTPVAIALALLVPVVLGGTHLLGALHFGDDTARSLGVRLNAARLTLLVLAVLLAGVATASAGAIIFIALAVPQVALRLTGSAQPPLLTSAMLGAAFTVTADLVARTLLPAGELPVGVITAVLGAPYLIYLLMRRNRVGKAGV
ncbi:iron chelate uptake ABC transporter family permease subunit [Nocardia fluminea]|uniref:FecCD family ABC transporter permease n=1 Tax=Nocardia fluminea TaxID=134984 RepID=UPI0033F46354